MYEILQIELWVLIAAFSCRYEIGSKIIGILYLFIGIVPFIASFLEGVPRYYWIPSIIGYTFLSILNLKLTHSKKAKILFWVNFAGLNIMYLIIIALEYYRF